MSCFHTPSFGSGGTLMRGALHVNLLCFAVTGSSVPGNRPVGMGGEGAYKHRHAHTPSESITTAAA